MFFESLIRFGDEPFIKLWSADSRLVARNQENTAAPRIKSEGHSPYTTINPEAKLLHVGVARTIQGIYVWSSHSWAAFAQRHQH